MAGLSEWPTPPHFVVPPALHQKYLAQLKERGRTISEFLAGCKHDSLTADLREATRKQTHSMAGSGGTYGFDDISTAARSLEHGLDGDERNTGLLADLAHSLLAACHHALGVMAASSAPMTASPPVAAERTGSKPLLLSADDDPAVRDLLANLFAQDAEIIFADNGREALKMVERRLPDLIILDDAMPEMSGMEVLETLRTMPEVSHIPVVMLTGSERDVDVMRGLMGGAVEYITKPFDPDQLAEKIRARLRRQRYTVLIADDDAAIRDLLEHKFRAFGCKVLLAEDGEQALQEAREHVPDLVILDRMMPGLDGIAVLQKLQQEQATRTIPVLFLTARRQEQDIVEGFRLGAADYIVKPFKAEEVLARSQRLLERKET